MTRRILGLLVGALACLTAAAQTPDSDAESPAVQQALAPFQTLIARLPPPLRDRLVEHARAWAALAPEEQALLRDNLVAWDDTPPQRKLALRERFEAWEHMDATTRANALDTARKYEQLPENIRQGWRERFDALPPEQRQRYLFDPATRAAVDLANALFPFVPAEQHVDTLAMLRALTPEQVDALRRSLARLPPAQRNAYRQRLLEMTPDARAEELGTK